MNNSCPVHMYKYAEHFCIEGDPEFACWIWHVLAKRNHIIGNMNSKYCVQTNKVGVNIPKSVQEAKEFDKDNSNNICWYVICK